MAAVTVSADLAGQLELRRASRDAWLFVLPLVTVAARRARPNRRSGRSDAINAFVHSRVLADPTSRGVTTPNNDTPLFQRVRRYDKGPGRA